MYVGVGNIPDRFLGEYYTPLRSYQSLNSAQKVPHFRHPSTLGSMLVDSTVQLNYQRWRESSRIRDRCGPTFGPIAHSSQKLPETKLVAKSAYFK